MKIESASSVKNDVKSESDEPKVKTEKTYFGVFACEYI